MKKRKEMNLTPVKMMVVIGTPASAEMAYPSMVHICQVRVLSGLCIFSLNPYNNSVRQAQLFFFFF